MSDFKEIPSVLLKDIVSRFRLDINGDHGLNHWRRVGMISEYLAKETEADKDILTLFSVLHDSCREGEFIDIDHGLRAAEYVDNLFKRGLLSINQDQLEKLKHACKYHNSHEAKSDDITIQICWDSDRLDLVRIGEEPNHEYLYTSLAKQKEAISFARLLISEQGIRL